MSEIFEKLEVIDDVEKLTDEALDELSNGKDEKDDE